MAGYIKDHRKELESDIWLMPPLYHRTWQWLKYNVNHADNEIPMRDGTKMLIKRGQRLTSVRDIAKGISWYEGKKYKEPNPKTVSAVLEWMIKTDMILINRGQGNREYTLITLINYEIYNEKESQGNSKVTPDGEGREQQADINKNDKECLKNEKNFITTVTSTRFHNDNPFALFETHKFGKLDAMSREFIGDTIDTYSEDWVIRAIKESIKSNVSVWKYVEGILSRWKATSHPEPWTLEKEEAQPQKQNNVRPFSKTEKPKLPIIADSPKSEPISDEVWEAMLRKAQSLDTGTEGMQR